MIRDKDPEATCRALEVFEPEPETLYSLDTLAHLAGVSRRKVLFYCRAQLILPRREPPFGAFYFDEGAVRTIRRGEMLRERYGMNLSGLRLLFELAEEVDRLRDEMRFLNRL